MKITEENKGKTDKIIKLIENSYHESTEYELQLKYVFLSWYLYNKYKETEVDMKAVTIVEKLIDKHGIMIKLDWPYQFCEDIFISTIMELPRQEKIL